MNESFTKDQENLKEGGNHHNLKNPNQQHQIQQYQQTIDQLQSQGIMNKEQLYGNELLQNPNINPTIHQQYGVQEPIADISKDSQVFTYSANWLIYALGFSSKPSYKFRLGIGSFLEDIENKVEVIQLNEKKGIFEKKLSFDHKYPPTKLMWIPDLCETYPDLLATSGETLKIWEVKDNETVTLKNNLVNNKQIEFSAPLTSFDWNPLNLDLIGTSSIDTTCTIWNITKGIVYTQLIAHDKEVYDISFAPEEHIFASVGADGSARQFDLRNLEHSTVLHETENSTPLLRLSWNKIEPNYLAVFGMDHNYITILDVRQPMKVLARLTNHKDCINAIAWAPHSMTHLCTVSDDSQALIWDISEIKPEMTDPLLEYKAEAEITNLTWSILQTDWLGICYSKNLQILKV